MERDEQIIIGGIVRDNAGAAVEGAWVRLDPTGAHMRTTAEGQFVFAGVPRARGYILRAQAVAIGGVTRTIDVPEPSGEYDLVLP
jgi:hypothetical protein